MGCIFESNLGYVECSVCGDGQNRISVHEGNGRFTFIRTSRCYGDIEVNDLDVEGLLEEFAKNDFLVATRYARRNVKEFLASLKDRRPTQQAAHATRVESRPQDSAVEWAAEVEWAYAFTATPSVSHATWTPESTRARMSRIANMYVYNVRRDFTQDAV